MAAAPQPTVGILPEEADLHTAEARVNKHKADWRGWKFMWPFAVVFVFVFIIPIVYAIYISFFKKQMVGGTKFVGFENYARLIQDPQFWSSVGRVTIFTVFQVPIMLFLAAAMALALDSMKLHGTKFFRISTFLPYAVPAVVSTMIWGFVYGAKYGLVGSLNDFLGTNIDVLNPDVLLASIANINTWEYAGYNMLIFYSSLSTIPHSLYEAASIDRASSWFQFWRITVPQVAPLLLIAVLFRTIEALKSFDLIMGMTGGGPGAQTEVIAVNLYRQAFLGQWQTGMASALAYIVLVIIIAISNLYIKYLNQMRGED